MIFAIIFQNIKKYNIYLIIICINIGLLAFVFNSLQINTQVQIININYLINIQRISMIILKLLGHYRQFDNLLKKFKFYNIVCKLHYLFKCYQYICIFLPSSANILKSVTLLKSSLNIISNITYIYIYTLQSFFRRIRFNFYYH